MTDLTGLNDLLDRQVRERPEARALVIGEDRLPVSYGVLSRLVGDVAAGLRATALRPGDAVSLVCANTIEFVVALLGAARVGLVVAPLDPALPESQRSERLDALGAHAILAGPSGVDGTDPTSRIPTWQVRVQVAADGAARVALETGSDSRRYMQGAAAELSADDALVLFTSGTTDRAKMVPLTHANVAASVREICATYELGPADATVAVMPFFHGHGLLAVLLASLASGGCLLLPARGRFSAHTFWDDARAVGATWFSAVPTIHQMVVLQSAVERPIPQIVPLRFVRSCSAPLSVATAREMERTFGAPVLSAYGMTETTHQAASEPLRDRGPVEDGSVGRATGVRLRVVDSDGHACPTGAEGEVWVSGPTVVRGYLANPAATAQSFTDGWFRTGDLGSLTPDGTLCLTGRIKNIINRGGEKISPEHIESVLAGCSGVVEAAAFAIADPMYGERVGVAAVLSGDISPEEILRCSRGGLAPFEVPERLEVVTELPHTAKGALDRRAVADLYAH